MPNQIKTVYKINLKSKLTCKTVPNLPTTKAIAIASKPYVNAKRIEI